MIKNIICKETLKIWQQEVSKKFPKDIQKKALQKLILINNAAEFKDLKAPPSNRLHSLEGDRKGQYSISINMKYRICFKWQDNNAIDLEIVDYH